MKKLLFATLCAALFFCGSTATAQAPEPGHPDIHNSEYRRFSPTAAARYTTDCMDSLLHFSKKQYEKVYKLNLKWAREDLKRMSEAQPTGERPERPPRHGGGDRHFGDRPHGNRQPRGMNGHPPRGAEHSNAKESMEQLHIERMKKLKKVLSDEQYELWMHKLAEDRKQENDRINDKKHRPD